MDKVVLLHQDGCPQCNTVEILLKKYGIVYESCKNLNKMRELGINHTPALLVGTRVLQGKEIVNYIKQFGNNI